MWDHRRSRARISLIEGENLQNEWVTLYKYRGEVDLIVCFDPPYNTGQQFRYNDKWDVDPNDPDLGTPVGMEDGSRHTGRDQGKRCRASDDAHAMLKPSGVIAVCIDENELYHLGMLMDEVFDENNRLAIINWQKSSLSEERLKACVEGNGICPRICQGQGCEPDIAAPAQRCDEPLLPKPRRRPKGRLGRQRPNRSLSIK